MSARTRTIRMLTGALLGIPISGVLLALLFHRFPFDLNTYRNELADARWWGVAAIVASTALHCQISAHKWRIVTLMSDAHGDMGRWRFACYSALIALFAHVMPLQVAVLAGRSLALRFHAAIPMRRSAFGAIYDQGFDLLMPILALPAAVLYFSGGADRPLLALMGYGGVLLVGGGLMRTWGARTIATVLSLGHRLLPGAVSNRLGLERLLATPSDHVGNEALFRLYVWSALRFFNLVFRACLVAWTLHMSIPAAALLFGHCSVTFAGILNFVPGALGVAEWSWVGLLKLAGVPSEKGMHYAVSSRLLIVFSLVLINMGAMAGFALSHLWRRRSNGDRSSQ